MSRNLLKQSLTVIAGVAALCACGGGTDDTDAGSSPVTTELLAGGWQGGVTMGEDYTSVQCLILENGTFWAIFQTQQGSVPAASSLMVGQLAANGDRVTSSAVRMHDLALGQSQPLSRLGGTFSVGGSLGLEFVVNDVTSQLQLGATHMRIFPYDSQATLAAVAGRWLGGFTAGNAGILVVSEVGTFEVTSTQGCRFTGRLTPSASGKNVFDATMEFGAAPCRAPGGLATGKALVTRPGTGRSQLALMGVSADGLHATVFYGGR